MSTTLLPFVTLLKVDGTERTFEFMAWIREGRKTGRATSRPFFFFSEGSEERHKSFRRMRDDRNVSVHGGESTGMFVFYS